MDNFYFSIPEEVYFGKGQIKKLNKLLAPYGNRVLLVYGGGSIKRNGLYDSILQELLEKEIFELSGVEPNPSIQTVQKGIDICKLKQVDVVLAVGGGSSIDCSKAICAGAVYGGNPWDLVMDGTLIQDALPLVVIPTMAATGSEMDAYAVISNDAVKIKQSLSSRLVIPKGAILDPTYTFSVPAFQTACGVVDILSHLFELYFKKTKGAFMQRRMTEALMETCFAYGEKAVLEPENYEAKANIFWASEWAINDFLSAGFNGYWSCHPIEHQVSAYYDVTHGAGLACITPVWMKHILNEDSVDLFVEYGTRVLHLDGTMEKFELANLAIAETEAFFKKLGLPLQLHEVGVTETKYFQAMATHAAKDGLDRCYFALSERDVLDILMKAY